MVEVRNRLPTKMMTSVSAAHALVTFSLCLLIKSSEGSITRVVGLPTVTLPGPDAPVLTGITVLYREPDFLQMTKRIDAYLGVPFAEPPVGSLRFADPVPSQIQESYNATFDRNICPQISYFPYNPNPMFPDVGRDVNEDCLYLSIYTPSPKPTTPTPVMVWIHGGGNVIGSGSSVMYEPIPLVALSDIILVNVNYRLGIFGYFTTGDDVATGNYGLKDQLLALHWIHDNIIAFGGDPQKVTIAGESSGGSSVGQHMLSPLSRDLFHQAILQSGNALCPWATTTMEKAAVHHRALAEIVGCPTQDSRSMLDCMRQVDEGELVIQSSLYLDGTVSSPIIDGYFMPDDPKEMIKRKMFQVIPTLLGSNRDEMESTALLLNYPDSLHERPTMNISTFREMMPLATQTVETPEEIVAVEHQYIDWSVADNATADQLDGFVRVQTDESIACPTELYARAMEAAGADVYRYEMTHDPAWSIYAGIPTWLGAAHAEELQYVFAWGLNPTLDRIGQTDEERFMSIEFMRYWTNFVISGNPNEPLGSTTYPDWPRFTMPEQEYKMLSLNMTNDRAFRAADCNFWINVMPRLHIQSAPLDDVYNDWNKQFETWRDVDMPAWSNEFNEYQKDYGCPATVAP